ncbi:sporulation inhibitor of replication protein SirA [Metabacillus sp. GX 13764]|uniref:sporulation inhibitor of replication protein SirA n=1 Tax=Metabacillus kandeliae TaxID=2900151 RepID=UPI001E5A9602|nr:sporulation inhibitor of replication protein SirA [Metabacillus kandeliae]MCD7033664.1 sporulation inhibitor of replication protein SirA [Metabacillus kandeliae]
MRHFFIYLIEEEFAGHYFGREAKMFSFFKEYQWTSYQDPSYSIVKKQVAYITKEIPVFEMNQLLEMHLCSRPEYQRIGQIHKLELMRNKGNATLIVKSGFLEMNAAGSVEAETVFFEILRSYAPCFLAMDFQSNKYGWLNPVKERKFV